MALVHSFEKVGNKLFKYRGQIPYILFLMAIPVIYLKSYQHYFESEKFRWILLAVSVLVSFSGQIVRAIAVGTSNKNTSGRNTEEQIADALNTKGIYSMLRHPLYLGNYLMWIGIVLYVGSVYFFVIVSLLFWIYYERIMFAEERYLERKFGEKYVEWSNSIPAFIPSMKNYQKSSIPFSLKTVLRREYPGISATILSFLFVEILRNLFHQHPFEWTNCYTILIIVALLISLILRSLKHYTKILTEEDRS